MGLQGVPREPSRRDGRLPASREDRYGVVPRVVRDGAHSAHSRSDQVRTEGEDKLGTLPLDDRRLLSELEEWYDHSHLATEGR